MEQMTTLTSMYEMACQIVQKKLEEKQTEEEQAAKAQNSKIPACCDDDDDYDSAITPNEPNLVPNPSESEGENGCDVLACFTTFSNILFDAEYEFDSVDDQSCSDKDVPEKIFSNPLFEEEINSMRIDQHHFNAESDLIESLLNRDSSIFSSSSKINSLLNEFASELTLLKSIPPGINDTDCHPENEIRLTKRFFDSYMEEIDLSFNPDNPMPPGIEDDDDDSEGDNLFLERLLHDDPIPLPNTLDFSYDVRVFLSFFTYPVSSSILLSSGSEDTIFDPRHLSFLFSRAGFISSVWNFQEIQYSP
uniref:Uncharacterized protein n=1 Tax=Tanacetum cinerariifolium TaxID=118510 RepID=A0A699IH83_TANCI|nr:hypothetical protein [Tanacetum cinerariifolium]